MTLECSQPRRAGSTLFPRLRRGLFAAGCVFALACHPKPSAELELPKQAGAEGAEPIADSPIAASDIATQPISGPSIILDWRSVDASLSQMITGERYRVDYSSSEPWLGAQVPLVTLVVFTDYQCPYCARLDETLSKLLREYPDTLRVVFRQFPLEMHNSARLASQAALAAHRQGAFAQLHSWMFANRSDLSRQTIEAQAARAGLDPVRFHADLDSSWAQHQVDTDIGFGKHFQVSGTPAFFINGRPFSGAQPIDMIQPVINEEIGLAQRLIAAGAPPPELWARFMAAAAPERSAARGTPGGGGAVAKTPPPPATRVDTKVAKLPRRGPKSANIEILVCGDFDCPFCARGAQTTQELLKKHGDVALFFRHEPLPMHTNARAAHRAAEAAHRQGKFWTMYDLLYAEPKKRSKAELEEMAKQAGLDIERFRRDIADPKLDRVISDQFSVCNSDLGATGTPTFFINGRKLVGAQPLASFEKILDEERAGKGPPPLAAP